MEQQQQYHDDKAEYFGVVETASSEGADDKPIKYQIIALLCTLFLSSGSHFANQAFSASKTPMKLVCSDEQLDNSTLIYCI
jgi:hypothetical protein